eukprot:6098764-Prymnesium_polylepis.2
MMGTEVRCAEREKRGSEGASGPRMCVALRWALRRGGWAGLRCASWRRGVPWACRCACVRPRWRGARVASRPRDRSGRGVCSELRLCAAICGHAHTAAVVPPSLSRLRRVWVWVMRAPRVAPGDVRVDTKLNKFLWSQGIKSVPGRVRVRLARKRNDDEEAAEKLYTLCQHVAVERHQYKGLVTQNVDE